MSTYDPEERRTMADDLEFLRERTLDLREEVERLRQERKLLLRLLRAARSHLRFCKDGPSLKKAVDACERIGDE